MIFKVLCLYRAPQRDGNQGLGVSSAAAPEGNDNEYDAYRKRMMLAYRFRPNPLVSLSHQFTIERLVSNSIFLSE